jgi:hypothetical protein
VGRHLMLMQPGAGWAWDVVLARSGHGRLSGLVGSIVRHCGRDGPTDLSP